MKFKILPDGTIISLYSEDIQDNLTTIFKEINIIDIPRASDVYWDKLAKCWKVNLFQFPNVNLGDFQNRQAAINAEIQFLNSNLIGAKL